MSRVRIAAVSVVLVLMAGGFAAWRLTRPPSFHEPASVAALGRAVDDVVPEALRRAGLLDELPKRSGSTVGST